MKNKKVKFPSFSGGRIAKIIEVKDGGVVVIQYPNRFKVTARIEKLRDINDSPIR